MFLIDAAHQRSRGRQNLIDEDKDGLFGAELDALSDNVDKLADGKVCGDKIFLLVDRGNVRLLDLLADNL